MAQTLTPDLLRQIMGCSSDRAEECFPAMVSAMRQFEVTTPARISCFLAVVKMESMGLRYFAELASGDDYEGRASLGNTHPGDGRRFKGSGPIQVTGRGNFTAAQEALRNAGMDINILENPDLARTVRYGFWISTWWWYAHGCNSLAERTPLSYAQLSCTKKVNTGNADASDSRVQGLEDRIAAGRLLRSFGDLALPGTTPAPNPVPDPVSVPAPVPVHIPTPVEEDDMYSDDDRKRDQAAAASAAQAVKDIAALKAAVAAVKQDAATAARYSANTWGWMSKPGTGVAWRVADLVGLAKAQTTAVAKALAVKK